MLFSFPKCLSFKKTNAAFELSKCIALFTCYKQILLLLFLLYLKYCCHILILLLLVSIPKMYAGFVVLFQFPFKVLVFGFAWLHFFFWQEILSHFYYIITLFYLPTHTYARKHMNVCRCVCYFCLLLIHCPRTWPPKFCVVLLQYSS